MVAAKNDKAHQSLSAQFKDHTIGRVYLAAVRGRPGNDSGCIEKPLARHAKDRKKIAVSASGREAVTKYEVLGRRDGISLLRLVPGTEGPISSVFISLRRDIPYWVMPPTAEAFGPSI